MTVRRSARLNTTPAPEAHEETRVGESEDGPPAPVPRSPPRRAKGRAKAERIGSLGDTIFAVVMCVVPAAGLLYIDGDLKLPIANILDRMRSQLLPAVSAVGVWAGVQGIFRWILPGHRGVVIQRETSKPSSLSFVCNSHQSFWLTLLIILHGRPVWGPNWDFLHNWDIIQFTSLPLSWVIDHTLSLLCASVLWGIGTSAVVSIVDAVRRRRNYEGLTRFGVPLKLYSFTQMSLLWLCVLALSALSKHRDLTGRVSPCMLLLVIFQTLYVWHTVANERDLLSQQDMRSSSYAHYILDAAVLPYILSLPTRSLLRLGDPGISPLMAVFAATLFVAGFVIFVKASGQKAQFHRLPMHDSVAHLRFIKTEKGPKLIVSGLWGWARRITTTGELLVALSFAILCGLHRGATQLGLGVVVIHFVTRSVCLSVPSSIGGCMQRRPDRQGPTKEIRPRLGHLSRLHAGAVNSSRLLILGPTNSHMTDTPLRPFSHDGCDIDPHRILMIARNAGHAIMKVYAEGQEGWDLQMKAGNEPVTRADKMSHEVIREGLAAAAPLPLISEEGTIPPHEERRRFGAYWCVDPLDGTKEFMKRNGQFTVNIGLVDSTGIPVFGVVTAPALGLEFVGGKGGAWALRGGEADNVLKGIEGLPPVEDPLSQLKISLPRSGVWVPMRVSSFSESDVGLVVVGSRSHAVEASQKYMRKFKEPKIVELGSSLKIMYIAEGTVHVYPRLAPTNEWDTCAADAILKAAGGSIVQLAGGAPSEDGLPLRYNKVALLNPHFLARGDQH